MKKNLFWEKVFRLTYPKLDAVVCLNEDEKLLFGRVNKNPVVIPNFISGTGIISSIPGKIILTVARLTAVKGIDLLLQTAKIVLRKHPDWRWKVIGDGDMKEEFIRFIEEEGLQNKLIHQPPVNHNIISEYQGASIYVMTSRNECFPMTLLEAMSVGLPCISVDCETGPREHNFNNEDGFLVEKENLRNLLKLSPLLSITKYSEKNG
ncbi:MAG: glycosyltransferase [Chitinophagaceae bacterium]|nr:glycosyltransferase [Chitinophagaceae bacterium]